MNTSVKFEIAKSLKEKGFVIPTQRYYEHALTSKKDSETNDYTGSFGWKKGETNLQYGFFRNNGGMADLTNENWYMCSAPTISEVVMWLYEKHGIWIEVYMDDDTTFGYLISEVTNEGRVDSPLQRGFNSPTDAYEIGIEWTLQKRI